VFGWVCGWGTPRRHRTTRSGTTGKAEGRRQMSRKALGNDKEMSMEAYRNDRVRVDRGSGRRRRDMWVGCPTKT
jgi:hypothetical protein